MEPLGSFELQVNRVSSKLFIFQDNLLGHSGLSFLLLKSQAPMLKTWKPEKTGLYALTDQLNFGKEGNYTWSTAKMSWKKAETDNFLNYVSA